MSRPVTPPSGAPPDLRPGWVLTARQVDDLELLVTGAYAPVTGYHAGDEAAAVRVRRRLPDGHPWPEPVTLAVDRATGDRAAAGGELGLFDVEGRPVGVMAVTSTAPAGDGRVEVGGRVAPARLAERELFAELWATPAHTRRALAGPGPLVAVTPAHVPDAATVARWQRATATVAGHLLVQVAVPTAAGRAHAAVVRGLRAVVATVRSVPATLQLVPAPAGVGTTAGDALQAVVAANHGASFLLSDRPPDPDLTAALGLTVLRPADHAAPDDPPAGEPLPEAATALDPTPPLAGRGVVVLLTGLSGAGKSTIARHLRARLLEGDGRDVTLLDGDVVRRHLSSELGFTREDRARNVRRIGWVAGEVARHGGIAICAPIAPHDEVRRDVRRMVEAAGGAFLLVHVTTPLEVCEARDVKGLYARARAGQLTGLTGVDDPYEEPTDADVSVDTTSRSAREAADVVVTALARRGWCHTPEPLATRGSSPS